MTGETSTQGARRRVGWLLAAAGMVVAIAIGVVIGLYGTGHSATTPPRSAHGSGTSSAEHDTPCVAESLRVAHVFVGGAGGTEYVNVVLELRPGAQACVIDAWPTATLLDHGRVLPIPVKRTRAFGHFGPHGTRIAPGSPAELRLAWAAGHDCRDVDNDRIRLTLAAGGDLGFRGFGRTMCNPGEPPETPRLSPPVPAR